MKEGHLVSEGALVFDKNNIILLNFQDVNVLIVFPAQICLKNVLFHYILILVQQACQLLYYYLELIYQRKQIRKN